MCSSDIICAVAGITSDANILIDYARLTCQRHLYNYHEPIPVEQLVQAVCNLKQSYTQNGGIRISPHGNYIMVWLGMRPFGCSFLWAGWDKVYGHQLYQSDPSGNYGGWKATCIGANNTTAQSIFKTDYEDSMDVVGAKKLLVKVLGKTAESASIVGEKLEYALLQRRPESSTSVNLYSTAEIDAMVKESQTAMETA